MHSTDSYKTGRDLGGWGREITQRGESKTWVWLCHLEYLFWSPGFQSPQSKRWRNWTKFSLQFLLTSKVLWDSSISPFTKKISRNDGKLVEIFFPLNFLRLKKFFFLRCFLWLKFFFKINSKSKLYAENMKELRAGKENHSLMPLK